MKWSSLNNIKYHTSSVWIEKDPPIHKAHGPHCSYEQYWVALIILFIFLFHKTLFFFSRFFIPYFFLPFQLYRKSHYNNILQKNPFLCLYRHKFEPHDVPFTYSKPWQFLFQVQAYKYVYILADSLCDLFLFPNVIAFL